jgi:plasmid maintenance system killer protein
MITVSYAPFFVRKLKKLPPLLQEEVLRKIEDFKDIHNHKMLKVHKLRGKLSKMYSFSVAYNIRIVFMYENKKSVILLNIGDHSVYD